MTMTAADPCKTPSYLGAWLGLGPSSLSLGCLAVVVVVLAFAPLHLVVEPHFSINNFFWKFDVVYRRVKSVTCFAT